MIKLKTNDTLIVRNIINPNDSLDFIISLEKKLNEMLEINNEKVLKKVKITLGASKVTSEQVTEEYKGVAGHAYIVKKELAGGDNGYFSTVKDRKVYTMFEGETSIQFKRFDNNIKFRFRCATAVERETLRTFLVLLLTFHTKELKCESADLDTINDLENLQENKFVLDLFVNARTAIKWVDVSSAKALEKVDIISSENTYEGINESDELSLGFL